MNSLKAPPMEFDLLAEIICGVFQEGQRRLDVEVPGFVDYKMHCADIIEWCRRELLKKCACDVRINDPAKADNNSKPQDSEQLPTWLAPKLKA